MVKAWECCSEIVGFIHNFATDLWSHITSLIPLYLNEALFEVGIFPRITEIGDLFIFVKYFEILLLKIALYWACLHVL